MKKPMLFLALEVLLVAALLLLPGRCQGSQGANANLTVTGTVFCDACSSSSFSNHSYFLPGVKVRIDCAIRASSPSREEVKITAERTTDSHGAYRLDIPAVAGLGCTTGGEAASFCRAAVLHNPSPLCDVPALTTTARHISFSSAQDPGACLYNLNSLYYRPGKKAVRCDGAGASPAAALNTSLFYCPHWPWPPIPFCTPRPWFPPIPFLTPPPPAFPYWGVLKVQSGSVIRPAEVAWNACTIYTWTVRCWGELKVQSGSVIRPAEVAWNACTIYTWTVRCWGELKVQSGSVTQSSTQLKLYISKRNHWIGSISLLRASSTITGVGARSTGHGASPVRAKACVSDCNLLSVKKSIGHRKCCRWNRIVHLVRPSEPG
ncbi:leucine-rich repeat extensin-like protein 3 [Hordeum vulgare]|nr:leucine-rich repeat extensin-like protein 3 [Hordeum vulgare]